MQPMASSGALPPDPGPARRVLVLAVVLAVAAFYALGLNQELSWDFLRAHLDQFHAAAEEHLLPALLLFFLLYVVVTGLSLPAATVLTLAAGALFGPWLGTGVVSLASTLGATLAFLGSRYQFRDFVQRRFGRRLEALDRGVEVDGAVYLLTLRLVPAVPFWLVNLGMGLTRMRTRTFVLVSLVGMLPATIVYVSAGATLSSLRSPADVLTPGVFASLALLAVLPLALRFAVKFLPRKARSQDSGCPPPSPPAQ